MVRAVSEDQIYDTIEFNEFLQMMSKQQKDGLNEGALKDAFRYFWLFLYYNTVQDYVMYNNKIKNKI